MEHIHSVSEKPPENKEHQREWLSEAAGFLPNETLKQVVKKLLAKEDWEQGEFGLIYEKVLNSFSDTEHESINDLSTLVLLDQGTNRGYGNEVFTVKRANIIKRERDGKFVPIATKNAFMKYYTESIENFTFWSRDDRQAYFDAMEATIQAFFGAEEGAAQ